MDTYVSEFEILNRECDEKAKSVGTSEIVQSKLTKVQNEKEAETDVNDK